MSIARSALEYLRLFQSLLPSGPAWNKDEDSVLTEFLYGQAEEFARIEGRAQDLLQERDTRYASELLVDHEIDLGLPDECSGSDETIQERRLAAYSRLIALGGQNPAYFIEIAEAYGWTVAITEYSPFICGVHVAGDECGNSENFFYWKVTVTIGGGNIIYFAAGESECGDYLSYLPGTDGMVCTFNKYKPAHTTLLWEFDGPEFGYGFSSAFDSLPASTDDNLYGAFSQEFGLGIDVHHGGGFDSDAFSSEFRSPN